MLHVDRINVSYGDIQVLYNVSFKVEQGSITTIVGPNSAGKTTILRTISGLLKPQSGETLFKNSRIDHLPAHKRVEIGMALVPEGRKLFPELTVMENLRCGSYLKKPKSLRSETLEEVFTIFPVLKERKDQLAGTLSGGEQQMLAIARGLMSKPQLLMLDEPSLGLAPKLVDLIFEKIIDLSKKGLTLLIVEEHIDRVLEIADYSYLLENGRITLEGKGEDLLENEYVKKTYLGI
jgi:branched-chain amino acid transport system ATP-binding protein